MRPLVRALIAALLLAVALAALVVWLNLRGEVPIAAGGAPFAATPELLQRGAYLARAGNCIACHTVRGGTPYAGGRGIATPFGTVYGSNLTPDAETGLGLWNADEFWRALHHGRSRNGRLLYPAFPYPNFTLVTRADSDALFAYLRSLPPAREPNRPHALRFPYDTQAALAVWRALFFTPATRPIEAGEAQRPAEWQRGAYLVRGLGHCTACHTPRNAFGASSAGLELGGGLVPMQGWYAPSLLAADEAGVAAWPAEDVVDLLASGRSAHGSVLGPMAEVVFRSTQYLSEPDLRAMALFLQSLPAAPARRAGEAAAPERARLERGGKLFERHCAQCHGDSGEGAPGIYPALAGNRTVTMDPPTNLIRVMLAGGYLPATRGNPRPHGMPPFAPFLDDAQLADLASYLRASWGHHAAPVSALEVQRARQGDRP